MKIIKTLEQARADVRIEKIYVGEGSSPSQEERWFAVCVPEYEWEGEGRINHSEDTLKELIYAINNFLTKRQ